MKIVADVLERLELGSPSSFANLTLFPLLGESGYRPDYATLDEAIEEAPEFSPGSLRTPKSSSRWPTSL